MKSEIEVFREFLSKKGMRNTPEREIIISEIFASHEHFDVDELHWRLRCSNCGRIVEFEAKYLKTLEKRIAKEWDFDVRGYKLEMFGYCHKCKR